jgi:quercetin dioxygenase-like cupin family protein
MNDLAKLRESNLKIDAVNKRLDALGHMLVDSSALKHLTPKYAGFVYDDSIDITTVFQSDNCTVTLGVWHKKDQSYPEHCHKESIEYLICMQESFIVKFDKYTRIISKGECVSVPINMVHSCIPLEDESEMFGICIPPEPAYVQCEEKE